MIIRTQKNELNIFQAEDRNQENKTGKNKNNDNKKECNIF